MTVVTRTKTDGGAWSTTVDDGGGGGGSLPAWWTVDSTPGNESVIFNGYLQSSGSGPLLAEFYDTDGDYGLDVYKRGLDVQGDGTGALMKLSADGGDQFLVDAVGAVTIYIPTDPDAVALNVSVDDLKNGSYQYAEFGSDSEWTARLFLNGWTLKGLTGEGETKLQLSHRDGTKALSIGSGESSDFIHAHDDASDLFIVSNLGDVKISPDAVDGYTSALNVQGPDGMLAMLGLFATFDGESVSIDNEGRFRVQSALGVSLIDAQPLDNKLAFFNATPVVKPTGVAVTAGGIHAALVTLGLIAA